MIFGMVFRAVAMRITMDAMNVVIFLGQTVA